MGSPAGGHIQIMHSSPHSLPILKAWFMSVAQSHPLGSNLPHAEGCTAMALVMSFRLVCNHYKHALGPFAAASGHFKQLAHQIKGETPSMPTLCLENGQAWHRGAVRLHGFNCTTRSRDSQ